MVYKKTLYNLYKEAGIKYDNVDDINKALLICNQKEEFYEKEINSVLCRHNMLLDFMMDCELITQEQYDYYYDKPSYREILRELDLILINQVSSNLDKVLIIRLYLICLNNIRKEVDSDAYLDKISKKSKMAKYKDLKDDIKRNNKEKKALEYQLKKLNKKTF